jgi:hypothetical protein
VVGEYRESEITPSLINKQKKPQDLGMTYSASQLLTSDTLAASDTAASVQIFREGASNRNLQTYQNQQK